MPEEVFPGSDILRDLHCVAVVVVRKGVGCPDSVDEGVLLDLW